MFVAIVYVRLVLLDCLFRPATLLVLLVEAWRTCFVFKMGVNISTYGSNLASSREGEISIDFLLAEFFLLFLAGDYLLTVWLIMIE